MMSQDNSRPECSVDLERLVYFVFHKMINQNECDLQNYDRQSPKEQKNKTKQKTNKHCFRTQTVMII